MSAAIAMERLEKDCPFLQKYPFAPKGKNIFCKKVAEIRRKTNSTLGCDVDTVYHQEIKQGYRIAVMENRLLHIKIRDKKWIVWVLITTDMRDGNKIALYAIGEECQRDESDWELVDEDQIQDIGGVYHYFCQKSGIVSLESYREEIFKVLRQLKEDQVETILSFDPNVEIKLDEKTIKKHLESKTNGKKYESIRNGKTRLGIDSWDVFGDKILNILYNETIPLVRKNPHLIEMQKYFKDGKIYDECLLPLEIRNGDYYFKASVACITQRDYYGRIYRIIGRVVNPAFVTMSNVALAYKNGEIPRDSWVSQMNDNSHSFLAQFGEQQQQHQQPLPSQLFWQQQQQQPQAFCLMQQGEMNTNNNSNIMNNMNNTNLNYTTTTNGTNTLNNCVFEPVFTVGSGNSSNINHEIARMALAPAPTDSNVSITVGNSNTNANYGLSNYCNGSTSLMYHELPQQGQYYIDSRFPPLQGAQSQWQLHQRQQGYQQYGQLADMCGSDKNYYNNNSNNSNSSSRLNNGMNSSGRARYQMRQELGSHNTRLSMISGAVDHGVNNSLFDPNVKIRIDGTAIRRELKSRGNEKKYKVICNHMGGFCDIITQHLSNEILGIVKCGDLKKIDRYFEGDKFEFPFVIKGVGNHSFRGIAAGRTEKNQLNNKINRIVVCTVGATDNGVSTCQELKGLPMQSVSPQEAYLSGRNGCTEEKKNVKNVKNVKGCHHWKAHADKKIVDARRGVDVSQIPNEEDPYGGKSAIKNDARTALSLTRASVPQVTMEMDDNINGNDDGDGNGNVNVNARKEKENEKEKEKENENENEVVMDGASNGILLSLSNNKGESQNANGEDMIATRTGKAKSKSKAKDRNSKNLITNNARKENNEEKEKEKENEQASEAIDDRESIDGDENKTMNGNCNGDGYMSSYSKYNISNKRRKEKRISEIWEKNEHEYCYFDLKTVLKQVFCIYFNENKNGNIVKIVTFLMNILELVCELFENCNPSEDFGNFSMDEIYLRFLKLSWLKNIENSENEINWSKYVLKYMVNVICRASTDTDKLQYDLAKVECVRVSGSDINDNDNDDQKDNFVSNYQVFWKIVDYCVGNVDCMNMNDRKKLDNHLYKLEKDCENISTDEWHILQFRLKDIPQLFKPKEKKRKKKKGNLRIRIESKNEKRFRYTGLKQAIENGFGAINKNKKHCNINCKIRFMIENFQNVCILFSHCNPSEDCGNISLDELYYRTDRDSKNVILVYLGSDNNSNINVYSGMNNYEIFWQWVWKLNSQFRIECSRMVLTNGKNDKSMDYWKVFNEKLKEIERKGEDYKSMQNVWCLLTKWFGKISIQS